MEESRMDPAHASVRFFLPSSHVFCFRLQSAQWVFFQFESSLFFHKEHVNEHMVL
jgi:hypothetical protein